MEEHGIHRGIWMVVILPGDADRRGRLGGKAGEVEVLGFSGNSSPELRLRTVSSGRGRSRHSEAQTKPDHVRETSSSGSCSTYGMASRILGSLVAEEI
jgi:hypothetical protein